VRINVAHGAEHGVRRRPWADCSGEPHPGRPKSQSLADMVASRSMFEAFMLPCTTCGSHRSWMYSSACTTDTRHDHGIAPAILPRRGASVQVPVRPQTGEARRRAVRKKHGFSATAGKAESKVSTGRILCIVHIFC
jgi:hypothetical protein